MTSKPSAAYFLLRSLEPGHLDLAGRAVGAPEVDDQGMAFEVGEGDVLAVEILQRERGRGLAEQWGGCVGRGGVGGGGVGDEGDFVGLLGFQGEAALAQVVVAGPGYQADTRQHDQE